ncbi:hypothetical protein [Rhizobium straminoryzae]|uniref:Sulfotransferase n=1 Tax=Rhizobium straminoryzae TaxID=1387186 RepID=A0A549T4S2_9HYPH|nr:hypothetical protein [Rhizobium straminoryzae]TRL36879.1 hypothetical protein FNA46_17070 [Rhizobium straminoryzae]
MSLANRLSSCLSATRQFCWRLYQRATGAQQKTFFLHVGTHKTGTTSIQHFLYDHREDLDRQGIYIPKAGRPPEYAGHHLLPWQMLRDKRIDPSLDPISDLVAELRDVLHPVVVVSSEDLEFVATRPDQLREFCNRVRALGYRIEIILYLRERTSYIQAIYREQTRQGARYPLDWYTQQAEETNVIRMSEIKCFDLDYPRLIRNLSRAAKCRVRVMHYEAEANGMGLLPSFLTILGADEAFIDKGRTALRYNVS